MKTWITILILVVSPLILGSATLPKLTARVTVKTITQSKPVEIAKPAKFLPKIQIEKFKLKVAKLESGGRYQIKNQFGMMGKYQFSKSTLKGLVKTGYLDSIPNNFLQNPEFQEKAMEALVSHNTDVLQRYGAFKYVGKVIDGVEITPERLLAGAHLIGPYATTHFAKTGSLEPVHTKSGKIIPKIDGNGMSVLKYMSLI